jgi:hypothetical protein
MDAQKELVAVVPGYEPQCHDKPTWVSNLWQQLILHTALLGLHDALPCTPPARTAALAASTISSWPLLLCRRCLPLNSRWQDQVCAAGAPAWRLSMSDRSGHMPLCSRETDTCVRRCWTGCTTCSRTLPMDQVCEFGTQLRTCTNTSALHAVHAFSSTAQQTMLVWWQNWLHTHALKSVAAQ